MKAYKKLISVLLSALMLVSLAAPAFAANTIKVTGVEFSDSGEQPKLEAVQVFSLDGAAAPIAIAKNDSTIKTYDPATIVTGQTPVVIGDLPVAAGTADPLEFEILEERMIDTEDSYLKLKRGTVEYWVKKLDVNVSTKATYNLVKEWEPFFAGAGKDYLVATQPAGKSLTPISVRVPINAPISTGAETYYINITEDNKEAFANAARNYVATASNAFPASIKHTAVVEAEPNTTITVPGPGYWMVYPTNTKFGTPRDGYGTIVSLTNTVPDAEVVMKGQTVSATKTEDANGLFQELGHNVGQIIPYKVNTKVVDPATASVYLQFFSDYMTPGLTTEKAAGQVLNSAYEGLIEGLKVYLVSPSVDIDNLPADLEAMLTASPDEYKKLNIYKGPAGDGLGFTWPTQVFDKTTTPWTYTTDFATVYGDAGIADPNLTGVAGGVMYVPQDPTQVTEAEDTTKTDNGYRMRINTRKLANNGYAGWNIVAKYSAVVNKDALRRQNEKNDLWYNHDGGDDNYYETVLVNYDPYGDTEAINDMVWSWVNSIKIDKYDPDGATTAWATRNDFSRQLNDADFILKKLKKYQRKLVNDTNVYKEVKEAKNGTVFANLPAGTPVDVIGQSNRSYTYNVWAKDNAMTYDIDAYISNPSMGVPTAGTIASVKDAEVALLATTVIQGISYAKVSFGGAERWVLLADLIKKTGTEDFYAIRYNVGGAEYAGFVKTSDVSSTIEVVDLPEPEYYVVDPVTKAVTWVPESAGGVTAATHAVTAKWLAADGGDDHDGYAEFTGLSDGLYSIEEVAAPTGYNKLLEPITIDLKHGETPGTDPSGNPIMIPTNTNQWVPVANNRGTLLPSTGGMGTTLFYVLGAMLALGAAVLLVTKRRIGDEA